jgi:hypothetical protein
LESGVNYIFPLKYLFKEAFMFEVTGAATTQIGEYFKGKTPTPIRVFLNQGG